MHWGLQFGTYFKVLGRKAITHIYIVIKVINKAAKGQLILKANFQAVNSSKKRTNEFIFTTMRRVFVHFLEEIEDLKKNFSKLLDP